MPSAFHQQFVQNTIDTLVEIGNRDHNAHDGQLSHHDHYSFKVTVDALSTFLEDYKKSVHEKSEEGITPASTQIMEVDGDKRIFVARCQQDGGVIPASLLIDRRFVISHFHLTLR